MKAVGVKVLKDQLSKYLNLVRDGEVVLITDRDQVIAEIRRPVVGAVDALGAWDAFLRKASESGGVRSAKRRHSKIEPPTAQTSADIQAVLDEMRTDRQ